jgi:hypothetical protein
VLSGQITLGVGMYRIHAWAMAYKVDGHIVRLQNTTDNTTIATGSSAYSGASSDIATASMIHTQFQITDTPKVIELQHKCQTSRNTNGRGQSNGCSVVETYAEVIIERVF